MLNVTNLTRRYGDFCAVDNISFAIGQGEIIGLLGHNGAGKTTTMKMITGFLEPSAGDIFIGDKNIRHHVQETQAHIGYLPEALPVYPEMIVLDYLMFCAKIRKIDSAKRRQAVYEAVAKTDLQAKASAHIGTLSRGYKQRVGVAQALLHNPKLLILDEPTNGLDPHQTQQMRHLILNLAEDATVILSTHIMQEVKATCDRIIILDSGKLVIDDSLDNLQKIEAIEIFSDASLSDIQPCLNTYQLQAYRQSHNDQPQNCCPQHYIIPIDALPNVDDICHNLAHAILQSGKHLYSLTQRRQDLEQIFKKSYQEKEEAKHAI